MKSLRKVMVTFLIIFSMIGGIIPIQAATTTEATVTLKYQGQATSRIVKYMEKSNGNGTKGYAVFDIKAYSLIGNDANATVKVQITYRAKGNKIITDPPTEIETINKEEINAEYFIEVLDDIQFDGPNANQWRVKFNIRGKNQTKEVFTCENIDFSDYDPTLPDIPQLPLEQQYPTVKMKTINRHSQIVNDCSVNFDANAVQRKEILPSPIILDPGAHVAVAIGGKQLDKQQYQVIESQNEPAFPNKTDSAWKSLRDIPKVIPNTKKAYPDLIDIKGQISTKHYNYKYNSTQYGAGSIPPRAETFDYPIGENLVIQKSTTDSEKQYYSTKDKSAFFDDKAITNTVLDAVYIPTESGTYQFGVYSNSGASGYLTVNGTDKIIVNDLNASSSNTAQYHSQNTEVTLQAGQKYPIHMVWKQKDAKHIAPRLQYKKKTTSRWSGTWSTAQTVPNTCFENEKYVGAGNKAVKFWGYIEPDCENGDYNLGAYSDDGAYGYVIIGNEKKEFVEDWTIAAAYNRTGKAKGAATPALRLEKGKVYPIYMEWYEGCPTNKAFIPRYTEAGKNNWRDIPEDWFYASSNTTPGDVNEAYFDAYTSENQIPLPSKTGTYYVAIQVTSRDGTARQVLHGPFKIQSIAPQITSEATPKNFICPESLSNISYNADFQEYSKAIKYELDFKDIRQTVLSEGNKLMYSDLNKAVVTIRINKGDIIKLEKGKNYTISGDGNSLIITLNDSFNAAPGTTQTLDIYIPTHMEENSIYSTYVNTYLNKQQSIKVTMTATPRIHGPILKPDGTVDQPEEYSDQPEILQKDIELKYVAMPKIY